MPGPKPVKKPRPKPIKWNDGTYSFYDGEDNLQTETQLYKYNEEADDYNNEDEGVYVSESGLTITVDHEGKISYIN